MNIEQFVAEVQRLYATGQATEHSYRAALGQLFDSLYDNVTSINEPTQGRSGRPDFVLLRGQNDGTQITVGHCEAKDIGLDISPRGLKDANKAQFERYRAALPNLVYTNGLEWRFYKNAELVTEIRIADFVMGIQPLPQNYDTLWHQLRDFAAERLQTIISAESLAKMMAGKALLMKDVLFKALRDDEELTSDLAGQFKAFKDQLIHDLDVAEFADIYSETIAYGMFAARLHDETKSTFSREEALTLLPKSNPFLRNLFSFVAGPNLNESLRRTIDELAEIFQATDLGELFANFGSFTQRNDPFIHFYETFLAEYNPAKRKARGVWYTPEPVVNFIVRAVDDVLKDEFGLKDGLADTSKITVDWDTGQQNAKGKPIIEKRDVHRVQILDPAAGTGTFLAEVVKQIAPHIKDVAPAAWHRYVEENLIPRLHGFELLMASYAMCHMKLDMMLTEMGYKPTGNPPRLNVYLTNTLEEPSPERQDLFMARWLSHEAQLADDVKKNTPIMCVIGNPPYSGESANKGDWIMRLMEAYKKEPGSNRKLKERNSKWINDDYVKFIRFAEHMIEKTGEGVLGFITNHGYLDNPTFRGMRWHLLKTFDKIWVIDLHGNAKKQEVSPDGSRDTNVFDIQQGVALIMAVKRRHAEKGVGQIKRGDVWGSREAKGVLLSKAGLELASDELDTENRYRMFYQVDGALLETYDLGFSLENLFPVHGNGIVTKRDCLNIHRTPNEVKEMVAALLSDSEADVRRKYRLPKDVRDWRYEWAQDDALAHSPDVPVRQIGYRLFDDRYIFYSGRSRGVVGWPVFNVMRHYLESENIGLLCSKAHNDATFAHSFVTRQPTEAIFFSATTGSNAMNFPLYLFKHVADDQIQAEGIANRSVNFDPAIRNAIEKAGTLEGGDVPDEVAIFDYIYGVLHCPAYRETYAEFLKIDFPRVPYPPSPEVFWDVSEKGGRLRRLHLMENDAVNDTPYQFQGEAPEGEDGVVGKPFFVEAGDGIGLIAINGTPKAPGQHFKNVPTIAWEFFIGGYQPAQKWLKDRKGRELNFDDLRHYQKIIKILSETDRIMETIEMPLAAQPAA
ncbi:DNA methyltransferase [Notoacmeibacter marinus]|uniref:site-specific DNA-methyltransferase (adenine-specific) n=1 Tax=Notoacmeibacter marinus TaxID=1876515 RepID=A0A231UXI9_9HYPH|nr:type ISP restriction/modification enzyme [Notoacmeibacter marinus]OXT00531.1 DNA methyltransferase [Notoacmeibacter marinus]